MSDLENSLNSFRRDNSFSRQIQDSLKPLPTYEAFKQMQNSLKPFQGYEALKQMQSSLKPFQGYEMLKQMQKSLKPFQGYEALKQMQSSISAMEHIRVSLSVQKPRILNKSLRKIKESIETISDEKWLLEKEEESSIHIDKSGEISLRDNSVDFEEFQEIAQNIIDKVFSNEIVRIEHRFEKLIYEVSSLKDPFLQRILLSFILPLLASIIVASVAPVADFYVKNFLTNHQKKQTLKEIKKVELNTTLAKSYQSSYKVVSADVLNVRKKGSRRAAILGHAYFGDVVNVARKGRKWSLIEWYDSENNVSLKGWVFSRYLKSLK